MYSNYSCGQRDPKCSYRRPECYQRPPCTNFSCSSEELYECHPGPSCVSFKCPKGRELSFTKIADTSARFYPYDPQNSTINPRVWKKISKSLHKIVKSVPVDEIFACKTCNRSACSCSDHLTDIEEDDFDCNSCTSSDRCRCCPYSEKCKNKANVSSVRFKKCPSLNLKSNRRNSKVCISKAKKYVCKGRPSKNCLKRCRSPCSGVSFPQLCPIMGDEDCFDSCEGLCVITDFYEPRSIMQRCFDSCRGPCANSTPICPVMKNEQCYDSCGGPCAKSSLICPIMKDSECFDDCTAPCASRTDLKLLRTFSESIQTKPCLKDCTSQCATLRKAVCVDSSCITNDTCKKDCSNQCKPICSDKCVNPCAVNSFGATQTCEKPACCKPPCSYMKDKKCYDVCKSACAYRTCVDKSTCPSDIRTRPYSRPFEEYMSKVRSGYYTPTYAASDNQQKCLDICTKNCRFRDLTTTCPKRSNPSCSASNNRKCVDSCTKKCASQIDQQNGCCKRTLCPNKTFTVCPKKINKNCCCTKTSSQTTTLKKAIKEYLSECDVLDKAIDDYIKSNPGVSRASPGKPAVNCACKVPDRKCAFKMNPSSSKGGDTNPDRKCAFKMNPSSSKNDPEKPQKYKLNVLHSRTTPKVDELVNPPKIKPEPVEITAQVALVKHNNQLELPEKRDSRSPSIIEAAVLGLRKLGSVISESFKTTMLQHNESQMLVVKEEIISRPSENNVMLFKELPNKDSKKADKKGKKSKSKKPKLESIKESSLGIIQMTKSMEKKLGASKPIQKSSAVALYSYKLRGFSRNSRLTFVPFKIYKFGERNSSTRTRGVEQDFYALRDYHLSNGTLFEDPNFPPTNSSLYYSRTPDRRYEWKRPHEIVDDPKMFVEGYSRFDVQQGELGDCWLLAAVANLTLYRRLFFQIVPDDNSFEEKYAGIFHFRFWQYGRWIDVVIDDKLPTYGGKLVFLHSPEDNEFWSALLEKAYAKLHGSYEALKGGSTCEAMEDFTGGVTEMYEMNAVPPDLFRILLKAYERSSLMGCSIEPDPNVLEAETPEGLIKGHAYSITRVKYVDIETPTTRGKIPLLRLRNPWGNETEWNGPWSDRSPEWRFIPDHEKEELGLTFDHDGEFWMSFKDFTRYFSRLEICNLNPDSLTEEEMREGNKKQWEMSVFEGEWVRGVTAGGCRNYLESFWHNPQYRITLTEVDDEDDDGKCTVIVALMQKNRRSQRNMGMDVLTIGFAIYYLPYPDRVPKPLDLNFFKYNASVARSPSFINLREVSCRFKLPPGTYCIVPSTFDPEEEGEFLLRVFSEHKNNMEENDQKVGFGELDPKVKAEIPTPETDKQTDKAYEFFLKIAGEDMEVGWKELKEILDYSMRNELAVNKKTVDGLDAAPNTEGQDSGDGLLMTILRLICGAVCKDSALIDVIPPPADASLTMSSRNEMNNGTFSKDICRSMVAMLDADKSGKLGYEEFKKLWLDLRHWKDAFKLYDNDNSGTLSGFELRQALNSAGYQVNNHILNILMHRYGNDHRELTFDDFIMCAVKMKCMIDIFKDRDPDETDEVTFTLEEWMENTLYS